MHVVFITPKFIPNTETGGAPIYNYSIIIRLLELGHQVTLIHFDSLKYNKIYPQAAKTLVDLGVQVVSFNEPTNKKTNTWQIFPRIENIHPKILFAPQVVPFLEKIRPDLVFAYGEDALASTHGISQDIPIAVQLGDPMHLIKLIRWQDELFFSYPFGLNIETLKWPWRLIYSTLNILPIIFTYTKYLKKLLNDVSLIVTVCGQHTERYKKLSSKPCYFTPIPLPDTIGPHWEQKRAEYPHFEINRNKKAKILWVGKPANTENRYAVRFFVESVFPELQKQIGVENFDVHFIGDDHNCPRRLLKLAQKHSNIHIRGHVHDIDSEWLSSDVYLVTNNLTIGARTRILSSFSAGCCVVAHEANKAGIPALEPGNNVLIGRNGAELALQTKTALSNRELRIKLGRNGRKVFEKHYELNVATQYILNLFIQTVDAAKAKNGTK